MSDPPSTVALDRIAWAVVNEAAVQFMTCTGDSSVADAAYRLRFDTVVAEGWAQPSDFPDGREHDEDDDRAVHVIGYLEGRPVCASRLVLPSERPLPTEAASGLRVEPLGQVIDVGRIVVASDARDRTNHTLVPLLARTYIEERHLGFSSACGMMAPPVRSLFRLLGFRLEVLGPDRLFWYESRAPVRWQAEDPVQPDWQKPWNSMWSSCVSVERPPPWSASG